MSGRVVFHTFREESTVTRLHHRFTFVWKSEGVTLAGYLVRSIMLFVWGVLVNV